MTTLKSNLHLHTNIHKIRLRVSKHLNKNSIIKIQNIQVSLHVTVRHY